MRRGSDGMARKTAIAPAAAAVHLGLVAGRGSGEGCGGAVDGTCPVTSSSVCPSVRSAAGINVCRLFYFMISRTGPALRRRNPNHAVR